MKSIFTKTAFLLMSYTAYSQAPTSSDVIDYNNARATVTDGGIYFNNINADLAGYEIHKGSGVNAIFSAAFWYAGYDSDNILRMSAQRYMPNTDIFPGPYSSSGEYANPDYISKYSPAIWKANRYEINQHIANYNQPGYVVPASIANWPGNGDVQLGVSQRLAPFVDLDQDGNYEPMSGDYPDIKGCQATYIIINDDAKIHTSTNSEKIGIEVHLMFYQYETDDFLNNTTFISKKIINRGDNSFSDFTTAFFMDGDFGGASDDYIGCDSLRNLMYIYNGDNFDTNFGTIPGYGEFPPSLGVMTLNEDITVSGYFSGPGAVYPHIDPSNSLEFWNFMNGRWANGSDMVYGGMGWVGSLGATSTPTSFMFSGSPDDLNNNWTEGSSSNPPGDRRSFMSVAHGLFVPGDTLELDMAVIFDGVGGTTGIWETIDNLKVIADSALTFYTTEPDFCINPMAGIAELPASGFSLYPNPTDGVFSIDLENETEELLLEIYDMSGSKVFSKKYTQAKNIKIDLEGYSGVFCVMMQDESGIRTHKLVID